MILVRLTTCVYCGNDAKSIDHHPALSRRKNFEDGFEVTCCLECNSTAGNKHFDTFHARATYLLRAAQAKGRVIWTILNVTVPIVAKALHLHANGNTSAQQNAVCNIGTPNEKRLCKVCGKPLSNKGMDRRRKYCGATCNARYASFRKRDREYKNIHKL